jgi:hypothetical protein
MASPDLPFVWRALEGLFHHAYRMQTLHDGSECLIAYNLFPYHGPDLGLKCGSVVREGDVVMELHFRREALLPLQASGDPSRMALGLLQLADRDMPLLAQALESRPELRQVKALHALTLFHSGTRRYGFEVIPVRSPLEARWFTWWHQLLLARDHAWGNARVREFREKLDTRHVWVSREAFVQRYRAGRRNHSSQSTAL